ncbi:ABC transporter ATP-binding protein [Paracidovorax sp. MALMAid1276]|uniref:ABC transporter ATP-binding protein n=1 Tax=Paracidovorax sp. MALMAid1276 TaxID=3411631 RepID=UPI003B9CD90C
MAEAWMLQVQGLRFAYPECAVLQGVSFTSPAGLVLVRGDESSGKTTLLRLLAGELTPQAGHIALQGGAARAGGQVFWADPRAGQGDAVAAQAWLDGLLAQYPQWDAAALAAHIDGFALQEHLAKPFYALSTGSKRKVLMAGALASGAALTLIDEPVGGLDKPSIAYLTEALAQVAAQPGRVVVVAHYEALPGVPWGTVVDLPG